MYEITIKKTEVVRKTVGNDWEQVGESDQPCDADGGRSRNETRNSDKPVKYRVMGYTPEVEKNVEVETELLKQTVEELDLAAVIKAINKL